MNKKKATWTMVLMVLLLAASVFTAAVGWGPHRNGIGKKH